MLCCSSSRRHLAKKFLFDEVMGYGIGYALHEDMELSMRLQREGFLLVGAELAPVFHDVHPSRRAGGFAYGYCWIANYLYACRRNIPQDSRVWRRDLPAFIRYKLALYRGRSLVRREDYYTDVWMGARTAWGDRLRLMDVAPDEAPAAYRELCDARLRG